MATLSYPLWLSLWYGLGPILTPVNRILSRIGPKPESPRLRALTFHDIPDERIDGFNRIIGYLAERYRIINPEEVANFLTSGERNTDGECIGYLLTFDDGFESQARVAEQVLDRFGIKGVFFVCPGLIQRARSCHREVIAKSIFEAKVSVSRLPSEMALMSWERVRQLRAAGHTIGSHALGHKRLSGLDNAGRYLEVYRSSDILNEQVGESTEWFAYPFGDLESIDRESLKLIADRYGFCCTGIPGENYRGAHPLGILRYNIDLDHSFKYQLFVLEGGMDRFYRKSVIQYRSMIPLMPGFE